MSNLNPYMWSGLDSSEGAILVFAHTAQKAKVLGSHNDPGIVDGEYLDIRVIRLEATEHIMGLAISDKPHVIDAPPVCPGCYKAIDYEAHWYGTKYCEGDYCRYDKYNEGLTVGD